MVSVGHGAKFASCPCDSASLHCNVGEVCIFGKTFSPRSRHCNPSESRMVARIFFRAENAERAEQQRERRSAKDSFSAPSAPLRAQAPSGRVWVAACRARPWNLTFGTRCFEQEKTERTEHRWTWSSLRCLRFLMFKKCVWLRLAALRLRVFALNPVCIDTLSAPTSAFSLLTLGGWHPNHWP
jgi:hypothetical protein